MSRPCPSPSKRPLRERRPRPVHRAGSQTTGNTIRLDTGLRLVLGVDRTDRADRENPPTANDGGTESPIGSRLVSDTISKLGSNVFGTDTLCP